MFGYQPSFLVVISIRCIYIKCSPTIFNTFYVINEKIITLFAFIWRQILSPWYCCIDTMISVFIPMMIVLQHKKADDINVPKPFPTLLVLIIIWYLINYGVTKKKMNHFNFYEYAYYLWIRIWNDSDKHICFGWNVELV